MSDQKQEIRSGCLAVDSAFDTLRLEIRGNPHPQPRPRWVGGQGMVSTMGPRVKAWRMRLAKAMAEVVADLGEGYMEQFHEGAVSLELLFRIPAPGNKAKWIGLAHHQTPDTDNLAKPVMDELQSRRILANDGAIARLVVEKVWCEKDRAGCTIILQRLVAPYVGWRAPPRVDSEGPMPVWMREVVEAGREGG